MNQEKMNKLAWKYFLEQKIDEVVIPFVMIIGVVSFMWFVGLGVPIAIGNSLGDGYDKMCGYDFITLEECGVFEMWVEGIFYIFVAFMIFMLLWWLFRIFNDWLNRNWKRAKLRAVNELKSNSIKRTKK